MFDQLLAEIVPSLTKGRPNNNNTNTNTNTNNNNNKAKCIPGGTLRVLAGKNKVIYAQFICSNRDVYIAIAICSKLLYSAKI
jgi:hypothetical protein